FVTLRPTGDTFTFDPADIERAFSPRTKLLLLNTPHNPTGKVFTRDELTSIAAACQRHGVIAVTDEVYEDLTYDPKAPHHHLAAFPGMADRTITLSSLGKTHSLTGWKIGWAIAPEPLSAGIRAAHQFLTFATATPLQLGAAAAIRHGAADVARIRLQFRSNRDRLSACLSKLGFRPFRSDGTYFIMASFEGEIAARLGVADDRELCQLLTARFGVAAIPPSVFYDDPALGRRFVRFAYCKKPETIDAAIERLSKIT
ncbi:MAG: aminotransferase class I/II-fold pyridoxal phosphate-dependent enzyme, partial [bacterium]|nr:aminotransferase class I/II-fold pyridoxal phosphate-dependent enzyme [bacterium]